MAPKMLAPGHAGPDRVRQVRDLMAGGQPEGVAGALLGMADRPDRTAELAQVRVPTLILTGAEDHLIPVQESEALAGAIPGAELAVLPRAGHLVAFEQPEAFNDRLAAWLRRIEAPREGVRA
jgi:pimeloyl-ACP methyl ester carboxylesterase